MTCYVWQSGWVETAYGCPQHFDCVESWRHRYGKTWGFDLHKQRFEAVAGPAPQGFWEAVLARLDPDADLFPRVSVSNGTRYLQVRPAPQPRRTTSLTHLDVPDPRWFPTIKGPDLARFSEHRRKYLLPRTDDIILGDFAETTTGALVGWEDETLIIPDAIHLPSTTQQLVVQRATTQSIPVRSGHIDSRQPVWFLNALHGISPVDCIASPAGISTVPRHPHEEQWRRWWRDWDGC